MIKYKCIQCNKKKERKELIRIKRQWVCKLCKKENHKNHREFLKRDILGIRKRADIIKEWAKRRKLQKAIQKTMLKKEYKVINFQPIIRGAKPSKLSKYHHHYLTRVEKEVLYKKYVHEGLTSGDANRKVKFLINQLFELVEKLKKKNLSDEEINIRFKESFAKLQ